jgi:ABC-2 type transport system ATP-binding protein
MIILKNVNFRYPKKRDFALLDISLNIIPGEVFSLLGPNGAGKTTVIRILSGLILPQSGTVKINGFDINIKECETRRSIGLVLGDERTFYFRLSGAQNLEFFGGLYGLQWSALKTRVKEVLELVGLEDHANLQYMRYSTGMKKRLALARALLHNPEVLLLDEPNSGVDPHSARKIREIIFSLKRDGRTILMTTHDMEEAEKMSDTIGFLKDGRLVKTGKVDEFKSLIEGKTLEIIFNNRFGINDAPILQNLIDDVKRNTICNSVSIRDNILRVIYNGSFDMTSALKIITRRGFDICKTNTVEATLEDVFIKLAG